jgi:hypothetical protein
VIAGQGIKKGTAEKVNPGNAPGGMSNTKCNVNIPKDSVPSAEGQSSGYQKHKRDKVQGNVENLNGFPKSRKY